MSATEIITVIKAINDHVTIKYCGVLIDYLTEKRNTQLLFERKFYDEMDKAVQLLLNNIATLLNPTGSNNEIMQKIQIHCTQYNNWKKNKYDHHLLQLDLLEKNLEEFIRKTFKAKLVDQHSLFDDALSIPLHQNTLQQDMNSNLEQRADDDNLMNLFNDNVTNSTIFSNSSSSNDKTAQQTSSDEEKSSHNLLVPNTNFPPFPTFPQIQVADNINPHLRLNDLIPAGCRKNKQLPLLLSTNNICTELSDNINININKPVQMQTNCAIPVAPPKPPPPPPPPPPLTTSISVTVDSSDSELSDDNIKNTEHYKCHLCDEEFNYRLRWESHLKTHQFSNIYQRNEKEKRKKKRNFRKINVDNNKLDVTNKPNKRTCRRYQCEFCEKQYAYSRGNAYIKHYNNHMITNKNIECNFCFSKFKVKQNLIKHINKFNAGMTVDCLYQCCQCRMRFERKNELTSHITSKHKMNSVDAKEMDVDFDDFI